MFGDGSALVPFPRGSVSRPGRGRMQQEHRGRWVYIPDPEETMTFQVGIMGSDGVVLASDSCHSYPGSSNATLRRLGKPKILISEDGRVVCCASGDDVSGDVAELCSGLRVRADFVRHIVDCRDEVMTNTEESNRKKYHGAVLAVDITPQGAQLYHMEITRPIRSPGPVPFGYACEGDRSNSAGFFLERYVPSGRNLLMENLVFIAAHTVLIAGSMNSRFVNNLELVTCTKHGCRRFPAEDLAKLLERSRQLDSDIALRFEVPIPPFQDLRFT